MLVVENIHVSVEDRQVLSGVNLTVNPGEVHVIMGPNGAGKSTLVRMLAGDPRYIVTDGTVRVGGKDLLSMSIEDRVAEGVFVGFQCPVEVPGVTNLQLLHTATNVLRKKRGEKRVSRKVFVEEIKEKMEILQLDESYLQRNVNEGFSGGEKKKNEILQMMVCEPTLAILDETDSGLDVDAMKVVAYGIAQMRSPGRGLILVTHYHRLLRYIDHNVVHVMCNGKIVRSGGPELAKEVDSGGFGCCRNGRRCRGD